jgi:hypothetical protein
MNNAPEKVWLDETSEDEDGFFIVEAEKRHGNMDVEYVRSDIAEEQLSKIVTAFRLNMMRCNKDYTHEAFDELIETLKE